MCNVRMCRRGSRLTKEDIDICEGCKQEIAEDEFMDDDGLCEECYIQAGIDHMEAYNDLD